VHKYAEIRTLVLVSRDWIPYNVSFSGIIHILLIIIHTRLRDLSWSCDTARWYPYSSSYVRGLWSQQKLTCVLWDDILITYDEWDTRILGLFEFTVRCRITVLKLFSEYYNIWAWITKLLLWVSFETCQSCQKHSSIRQPSLRTYFTSWQDTRFVAINVNDDVHKAGCKYKCLDGLSQVSSGKELSRARSGLGHMSVWGSGFDIYGLMAFQYTS
jgi:hypothetical protein